MAANSTTILKFPGNTGAEQKLQRKGAAPVASTAEIIIFPGVRIERWKESGVDSGHEAGSRPLERLKKRAAAVRRDTLELLD